MYINYYVYNKCNFKYFQILYMLSNLKIYPTIILQYQIKATTVENIYKSGILKYNLSWFDFPFIYSLFVRNIRTLKMFKPLV